jgi:flagellar motility protein MotE (MotC chaperone)
VTKRMRAEISTASFLSAAMSVVMWTMAAAQQPRTPEKSPAKPAVETTGQSGTPPSATPAIGEGYCIAIRTQAASDQTARDQAALQRLAGEVEARIKDLELKIADTEQWLAKRNAFAARARDSVVQIYAKMQPEAAAVQLVAIAEETAAAVLLRLDAKLASAIMAEMEPSKAARLASLLVLAGDVPLAPKSPTLTRGTTKPAEEMRR